MAAKKEPSRLARHAGSVPSAPGSKPAFSENGQVFAAFHGDHIQMFEGETLRELAHTDSCGDCRPITAT